MTRSRKSAKAAGSAWESDCVSTLQEYVSEFVVRNPKHGAKDTGDVANVRTQNNDRVVIEAKNVTTLSLAEWVSEAEVERVNDGALVGVVWHKKRGKSSPLDGYVTMSGRDFLALLTGKRPE